MPGPAPVPTSILAARGSRLVENRTKEPHPTPGKPVKVRKLTAPAKRFYDATIEAIGKLKVLTVADGEALEAYAILCAEFDKAIKDRDIRLAVQIEAKLSIARSKYGLTPADRARVQTTDSEEATEIEEAMPVRMRIAQ